MRYVTKLPFMNKDELKELAYQAINNEIEGLNIIVLYPFLDYKTLDEIVDKLIETNNSKALKEAVPFVSKSAINKIYDAVQNGTIKEFKEEFLLPFLGKDRIKEMFKDLIKTSKEDSLNDGVEDEE